MQRAAVAGRGRWRRGSCKCRFARFVTHGGADLDELLSLEQQQFIKI
jgi:hypothetical protein